jgi:hypothetical protein
MEYAALAPKYEVSMFPWKQPKAMPIAVRQIHCFVKAHQAV